MTKIKILGISGSLSKKSSNAVVLRYISSLSNENIDFIITDSIGALPHFNPELDAAELPAEVEKFRNELRDADAVLICTPEYAFGVPGSLKNALDWTVSSGEFVGKPLALITASLSGEKAQAALLQIFTALSAKITGETTLLISFIRSKLDENGNFKNTADIEAIKKVIDSLIKMVVTE
jgi:NAD(P)H-dependent FMN reductase